MDMPYKFYVTNNGVIALDGEMNTTDQLIISNELIITPAVLEQNSSDIYIYQEIGQTRKYFLKHTRGVEVAPSGFGIGPFLISDGFGPCILVIAKLTTGKIALYHAPDPHVDIMMCEEFLKAIKGKVISIDIFQKMQARDPALIEKYEWKAKLLEKELKSVVDKGVEISIVEVKEYSSAIISGDKVFLSPFFIKKSRVKELGINNMENKFENKSESSDLSSPVSLVRKKDNIKTIYVMSLDGDKHRRVMEAVLQDELERLSQKTSFCGFLTYNMKTKTQEFDRAFYSANSYFPVVNNEDIENFLNFKATPKSKSIKEILVLSSSAYKMVCKNIKDQFFEIDKSYLSLNI